jgi:transcriptional regulator with XRE-family HTH domain
MGIRRSTPRHTAKPTAVDWKTVGRRIRELRGFDLSQQDFANRIGISQTYVSDIEHGKVEVGAEILLRIARQFGKTMEWLLTGEEHA